MLLTALRPSRDGRARIVRLYNPSGQTKVVSLKWADPAPTVCLSDFAESPGRKLVGPLEIAARDFVTLRADLATQKEAAR